MSRPWSLAVGQRHREVGRSVGSGFTLDQLGKREARYGAGSSLINAMLGWFSTEGGSIRGETAGPQLRAGPKEQLIRSDGPPRRRSLRAPPYRAGQTEGLDSS